MTEQLRSRIARRSDLFWPLATVVTVLVLFAIPLLWTHRYYFYGDTQIGAFPQWYHLGSELRAGHWPVLSPDNWRAGNYTAEGQWGIWNPLIMLIGLGASFAGNAMYFSVIVKALMFVTAATGGYVLARSYGTQRRAAYLVGIALPLGGETQYLDSPTWVTGLLVWSLLPWAWWAIRRTMLHRRNPVPALAVGYLIVTVGYVYGTMYLALVIVACLVDTWVTRDRAAFLRVLLIGVCAGLLTITVYLPGILSASVTTRADTGLYYDARLPVDLRDLVVSVLPTGIVPARLTQRTFFPIHYTAWFLPLLMWIDVARLRTFVKTLTGVFVMLGLSILYAIGPSVVGPLRYPARTLPYIVLGAVLLTVVMVSRASARPTRARLAASLGWVVVAAYLSISRAKSETPEVGSSLVLVVIGIVVVWLLTRRARDVRFPSVPTVAFMAVWTILLLGVTHHFDPLPNSTNRNMPSAVADYKQQLAGAQGDAMLVGDPHEYAISHPAAAKDFLVGSSWYVSGHPIQNTYTVIGFSEYNKRYCMTFNGATCAKLLDTLFTVEPTTGMPRVDLLRVSTLLIRKADFKKNPAAIATPPVGWHVEKDNAAALMWVRDTPLPTAGDVAWTSDGTRVELVSRDDRNVRFKVLEAPSSGGTVVFSRLAWPGYSASEGTFADPVDRYLLTLDVPANAVGRTVDVSYSPPAWGLSVGAWGLSVLLSLVLSGLALWGARRRRPAEPATSAR
ncbi:MAG: hypothetical protein ABIO48_04365 [Pedococcus sp.]